MNYNEAEKFKTTVEFPIIFESIGESNKILITPNDLDDLKEYLENYKEIFKDDTAKLYCSDGQYAVRGFLSSRGTLYHKKLSE